MSDLFLERDAVISDCGKYRYLLRRTWGSCQSALSLRDAESINGRCSDR